MGLYNFQKRFVSLIVCGAKQHTIRGTRVHPDRAGDILHLYTGLRTKKAKLLGRYRCSKVENILIDFLIVGWPDNPTYIIKINGCILDKSECEALARRDGFNDFAEMMKFWREPTNRLPFQGHIIHWKWFHWRKKMPRHPSIEECAVRTNHALVAGTGFCACTHATYDEPGPPKPRCGYAKGGGGRTCFLGYPHRGKPHAFECGR